MKRVDFPSSKESVDKIIQVYDREQKLTGEQKRALRNYMAGTVSSMKHTPDVNDRILKIREILGHFIFPTDPSQGTEYITQLGKYGFNKVYRLNNNQQYNGNAENIILVWNENQIVPAEQYRKANYPDATVDIVICENPNIQKEQLGDKAIIYHF
jgi:hypothetical protein